MRSRSARPRQGTPVTDCINTHDQLVRAEGGIAIVRMYSPGLSSRRHWWGWGVYRVGKSGKQIATDPTAAWYHYGKKVFIFCSAKQKEDVRQEAQAWVLQTYGEAGPWKRNSMGDYVPERIAKAFPLRKKQRHAQDRKETQT